MEFEVLYQLHETRLRRHALVLTHDSTQADDLMQVTAIRGWRRFDTFDGSRCFLNWMMTIMRNAHLDELRHRSRRPATISFEGLTNDGGEFEFIDASETLDDRLVRESFWSTVWARLSRVPSCYREVLAMVYVREMSYEECAQEIGVPTGTVRSRLSRGKLYLRQALATEAL